MWKWTKNLGKEVNGFKSHSYLTLEVAADPFYQPGGGQLHCRLVSESITVEAPKGAEQDWRKTLPLPTFTAQNWVQTTDLVVTISVIGPHAGVEIIPEWELVHMDFRFWRSLECINFLNYQLYFLDLNFLIFKMRLFDQMIFTILSDSRGSMI